jgi:acetyl esterase
MPMHPEVAALLALMAAVGDPPIEQSTPEAVRAARKARQRPPVEAVHQIVDVDADGVRCRLYRPSDAPVMGLLVYLHGGGWVIGDLDSHDNVCRALANGSGHAVLSVDYRLAPEHPFPAGLEDAFGSLRWAATHADQLGIDPDRIAIGGDSAGANLAAVVAHHAPVPLRFQLLVYPVTDATQSFASYTVNGTDYFLTTAAMSWFIDHYLSGGVGAPNDPRVSPWFAADHVLAGTPPALVITAELDPLRDEGEAYARRLADLGVATTHVRFDGTIHGFVSLGDFLGHGRAAQALCAAMVRAALEPTGFN